MKINFKIIKWAVRVGYVLTSYSALVFLVNYFPVDLWAVVSNIFTSEEEHIYYKVVATEGSKSYALATLVVGVTLIITGKLYSKKENT